MPDQVPCEVRDRAVAQLRREGAGFALVHGSRARRDARSGSDLDVAAWWPGAAPYAHDVLLATGVDLLVLNRAPLELAGRAALQGVLLFDDVPEERVRWLATTRKIYFDELSRLERSHREFLETAASRGR